LGGPNKENIIESRLLGVVTDEGQVLRLRISSMDFDRVSYVCGKFERKKWW